MRSKGGGQGEGVEAVHRQARQTDRERDLPAGFTWTSVRADRATVRGRERETVRQTGRQRGRRHRACKQVPDAHTETGSGRQRQEVARELQRVRNWDRQRDKSLGALH